MAALDSSPRFCPRCVRARPDGSILCAECGEALVDRGFCGVCDRFWNLRIGDACPKHEVSLDDGPPPSLAERLEGDFTDWASVAAYPHPMAAEGARIRLEAEGIPTFVEGARMGEHGLYQLATGGVRLQVPRDLAAEARILLAQSWAPIDDDPDDLDDAFEDLAPEPGARRRAIMRGLILVFLLLPLFSAFLAWLGGR